MLYQLYNRPLERAQWSLRTASLITAGWTRRRYFFFPLMLNGTIHWTQEKRNWLIILFLYIFHCYSPMCLLCCVLVRVLIIISSRPWTTGLSSLRRDTPLLARPFKERWYFCQCQQACRGCIYIIKRPKVTLFRVECRPSYFFLLSKGQERKERSITAQHTDARKEEKWKGDTSHGRLNGTEGREKEKEGEEEEEEEKKKTMRRMKGPLDRGYFWAWWILLVVVFKIYFFFISLFAVDHIHSSLFTSPQSSSLLHLHQTLCLP